MNLDEQRNILVTGGSGLVGSHLIQLLVQQNKKVKALYRNTIPSFEYADKAEWVQGDILDILSLEEALSNVQQVYHCAAMVSFNPKDKAALHTVNIEGTANIVNACLDAGIEKLVYVSSVSAMGRIREDQPVTEKMKWSAGTSNSVYGKTKYLAEMEVWRGVGEGLNAVIINPTIILGAADWTKSSTAIFKNVYNEFPWYSEGITGFVDVADVVKAMTMLMESNINGERFIVSGEDATYRNLLNLIAKGFGKKPPYKKVTPFLASLVWRAEKLKSIFTGKKPLITKETARTAQAKVHFDNSKLLQYLPSFNYQPLEQSIQRICAEFKKLYKLP
ncbi:NAD-dependent epimerase/dehydratase family protein [Panacibacter ginsenosidivorans]|uniref:NAD-dependent epimerase/dehydratase family protein n=1 Tax=Panacibacter ginsenosidivorans TaxID=1813871 RepID=A0A5B8VAW2_9BACT|nr:NAD-dependent epimerase/dehydratase family protein [Panacibacter ginsenosidivorans]QEC68584.1 NAD-dependent epimerase/dehydratase family protein [Panacibacter ginsenosidivorans]